MICSNCSNAIDSKTKFCPYCDAPIEAAPVRTGLEMLAAASKVSNRNPAVKRYVDLYRTAYVMTRLGTTVKTIGLVAALVVFFFWFIIGIAAASGTSSLPFTSESSVGTLSFVFSVMVGVLVGAAVGGLFFLLGVLISAQGQLLLAHADSAVHTSPFLSDSERASAMSLPYSAPAAETAPGV